jgi:ATP-dependent Clp protease protease subunit
MPDGSTIVVQDGVIAEIRPKEDAPEDEGRDEEGGDPDTTEELDDRDEEEQRLRDRIAELEKENEELRQRLEEATANAKTTDDLRILNLVKMAGGEKALAKIKTNYKPAGREPDGKMAEKRATAQAMTADDIIAAADNAKKKK